MPPGWFLYIIFTRRSNEIISFSQEIITSGQRGSLLSTTPWAVTRGDDSKETVALCWWEVVCLHRIILLYPLWWWKQIILQGATANLCSDLYLVRRPTVRQRTLNSARHFEQRWHCRRRKFWIRLNFCKSTPSLSVLAVMCNPLLHHDTNCHWRTFRLFGIMIMNFQIINWLSINFKALRDVTRRVTHSCVTSSSYWAWVARTTC